MDEDARGPHDPSRPVGIVTVTFNSEGVLEDFLASVRGQLGIRARLYVVDSGSVDGTIARVRSEMASGGSDIVLLPQGENIGIAAGNNIGIDAALSDGCDRILFLNNDTVFGPTLVRDLVRVADENGIDLLSPVIEATEPRNTIWYTGGTLSRTALVARHEREGHPMSEMITGLHRTGFGSACCLLVHPRVLRRVGMMDPLLFVYFDDVEFAVRARRAGFEYWVTSDAVLLHKASALTGGKRSEFTLTWTSRNWPWMIRRHQRGLRRIAGLAFVQLWIAARWTLRRDSTAVLLLRQRSFRAALRLPIDTRVPYPVVADA